MFLREEMFCRSIVLISCIVCWFFCLIDGKNGVLKFPVIIIVEFMFPFTATSTCLKSAGTLVLGAYPWTIVTSSCGTDFLIIAQCPSLSLERCCVKVYFIWRSDSCSCSFSLSICMLYLIPWRHVQSMCTFVGEVCFLQTGNKWVLFLQIHSTDLCIFLFLQIILFSIAKNLHAFHNTNIRT